ASRNCTNGLLCSPKPKSITSKCSLPTFALIKLWLSSKKRTGWGLKQPPRASQPREDSRRTRRNPPKSRISRTLLNSVSVTVPLHTNTILHHHCPDRKSFGEREGIEAISCTDN